jgi:choline-sulfatase
VDEADKRRGLTRRELVERGAAAAPALLLAQGAGMGLERALGASSPDGNELGGMNILIFLTDQDRAIQHFPKGWAARNLPGLQRLKRHGLSFENAFTNACMCSPARSTLMTGFFPAQHGVKYTLEEDMPADQYPQVEMPTDFENLATVAAAAGYTPVYKGKWHCSKPARDHFTPADLKRYGFGRWDPPDGGANQDINQAGGGYVDHDGRYINATGNPAAGKEGALQYLSTAAARQQPFFMVVSLVNPHDVLFYPSNYRKAGYDNSWLDGEIDLPATVNEDLSTKPDVQEQFLRIFNLAGRLKNPRMKRAYLNFYGNLMRSSDNYLVKVLDKLEQTGLLRDTLIIRTADHGEMGLAHGGLRQKNFNFYEESLRVPMIYSNPRLYPKPCRSHALVSHVDFLPTLANLVDAPKDARADWEGRDYSRLVLNPNGKPVQNYTVFTYDDYQSGQANGPYPKPPNHIVSIRERRWKLAKYYDVNHKVRPQWEMYDLKNDPLEKRNLASHRRTPHQEREFRRLKRKLARVQKNRLQPLSSTPSAARER